MHGMEAVAAVRKLVWKRAHVALFAGQMLAGLAGASAFLFAVSAAGTTRIALGIVTVGLFGAAAVAALVDVAVLGELRRLGVRPPTRRGDPDAAYLSALRAWCRSSPERVGK